MTSTDMITSLASMTSAASLALKNQKLSKSTFFPHFIELCMTNFDILTKFQTTFSIDYYCSVKIIKYTSFYQSKSYVFCLQYKNVAKNENFGKKLKKKVENFLKIFLAQMLVCWITWCRSSSLGLNFFSNWFHKLFMGKPIQHAEASELSKIQLNTKDVT